MNKFDQLKNFFQKEIWEGQPERGFFKQGLYRWMRILYSSIQGFISDNGFDKASTLTFYTLLAVIPLIAISFGIAQELGFADILSQQIKTEFQHQPEVADKLIQFSNSTLKTQRGSDRWIWSPCSILDRF